jgi:hypothetical protein
MAVFMFYIGLILAFCFVAGLIADTIAILIGGVHPWDFC